MKVWLNGVDVEGIDGRIEVRCSTGSVSLGTMTIIVGNDYPPGHPEHRWPDRDQKLGPIPVHVTASIPADTA